MSYSSGKFAPDLDFNVLESEVVLEKLFKCFLSLEHNRRQKPKTCLDCLEHRLVATSRILPVDAVPSLPVDL